MPDVVPLVQWLPARGRAALVAAGVVATVAVTATLFAANRVRADEPTSAAGSDATIAAGAGANDSGTNKAARDVALTIGGWDDVEKRVAAHRGKVVLVSIWTTTCGACKEELPRVFALQNRFPADKFVCLTVACDYDGIPEKPPAFYRDRVRRHLATQKLGRSEHFLLNVPFADFLEARKLKSTPAVYLFGPDGKLARRFDNDAARRAADEYTVEQVGLKIAALSAD